MIQMLLIILGLFLIYYGRSALATRISGLGIGRPEPIFILKLTGSFALIYGIINIIIGILYLITFASFQLSEQFADKETIAVVVLFAGLATTATTLLLCWTIQLAYDTGKYFKRKKSETSSGKVQSP